MIRRLAVAISFVAISAAPALAQAQTHPPHPTGAPHDPTTHPPMDPALHAALHARFHGDWVGTMSPTTGSQMNMKLAVANDKQGKTTLKLTGLPAGSAGSAQDVSLDEHGLHWTQQLAGSSCKATAILGPAPHHGADTITGRMDCDQGPMTFALQKAKH